MGSLCPFCLNTPSKYFFADITGVEKNPWTTMKTDERLHLETSALENSLRNGNQVVTLSTQLIKSNFLIKPPPHPTPAPQFLKELARFIWKSKQSNTSPHTHTHTQKQMNTKLDKNPSDRKNGAGKLGPKSLSDNKNPVKWRKMVRTPKERPVTQLEKCIPTEELDDT